MASPTPVVEIQPLFSEKSNTEQKMQPGPDPKHPYVRRKLGCPCPAIATMINHSYLTPKDENERIPWYKVVSALVQCYNFSIPFALIFTLISNITLRTPIGFSVKDLGKHGFIEHDASITRYDKEKGDYLNPQQELIENFFDSVKYPDSIKEEQKMITLNDYAKKRLELENKLISFPPHQSKSLVRVIGVGEAVLALHAFEDTKVKLAEGRPCARSQWLKTWYSEERLPVEAGWKVRSSERKITLHRTLWDVSKLQRIMKK